MSNLLTINIILIRCSRRKIAAGLFSYDLGQFYKKKEKKVCRVNEINLIRQDKI